MTERIELKIVVVGDGGVGKTTLIHMAAYKDLSGMSYPRMVVESSHQKEVTFEENRASLKFHKLMLLLKLAGHKSGKEKP